MSQANTADNVAVVANATQLGVDIIMKVAGNDVSNYIKGSPITQETLAGLAAATFNQQLGGRKNA